MKNKMKIIGVTAVIAIAAFYSIQSNRSKNLDDILLKNIEALAAGESDVDVQCIGTGSVICPINKEGVEHVYISYSLLH